MFQELGCDPPIGETPQSPPPPNLALALAQLPGEGFEGHGLICEVLSLPWGQLALLLGWKRDETLGVCIS